MVMTMRLHHRTHHHHDVLAVLAALVFAFAFSCSFTALIRVVMGL